MGKQPRPTTMDNVKAAILRSDGAGSLYRWLRQNHDEFQETLDLVARPNWTAIADAFAKEPVPLLDAAGKVPNGERVRQTWFKVKTDVRIARERKARTQASSAAVAEHNRKTAKSEAKPEPVTTMKPEAKQSPLDEVRQAAKDAEPWNKG